MVRFIAFDVETPNSNNDRMSSIGVSVIEDGQITEEYYYVLDPETHFDAFNVMLTGLSEETAAGQPTFPEVWEKLEPVMCSGVLAAHSAQFDMSVLAKCLRHYGLRWQPYAPYLCTCTMGRACLPAMPNYKLSTLCDELCIALDHHNAGSDSHACAELLLYYLGLGADVERFIRTYDLDAARTLRSSALPGRKAGRRRRHG